MVLESISAYFLRKPQSTNPNESVPATQGQENLTAVPVKETVSFQQTRTNHSSHSSSDANQAKREISTLENSLKDAEVLIEKLLRENRDLKIGMMKLERNLKSQVDRRRTVSSELELFQHKNIELQQQNKDLENKYIKKTESYKKLEKDYIDLVRPILLTDDDHSTIYRRLMDIRVSIENLVQKARGFRSANLNKEQATLHFAHSGLLEVFPIPPENLESYHLDLYMESAVMSTLIDNIFCRPFECIFDHSQEFQSICRWVDARDTKMARRWRQQLCVLASKDTEMKRRREEEVNRTITVLLNLVSTVYSNVDMSEKIKELCFNAFDLSFAMIGMESAIYPVPTPLGTKFDDETMVTTQKSNPTGIVSLVIFPAFVDESDVFKMQPKVWCV